MTDSLNSKFLDDPEFQSLLVGCLESLQRGETIDREALASDFPKYAGEIEQFLTDRRLLEQVAADLGDVEPSRVAISAYEKTITSDSDQTSDDFTVGETVRYIGEYEILDEIARGGMGVVFRARQQKLQRTVALKMILAGKLADAADVERFHREARAAGQLKHTNIVPVHEVGQHEGRHYFTMAFVEGRSLGEAIRDETLAPRTAAEIVRVTAQAVHYAHEQGIVHRDLKPANVLLDKDQQPHVTDFGLARMLESVDDESRAELTASGQILGTPSYMSPEQAAGKQEQVGPASDIYSLGAILYACLTGRAPFVADSPVDTLLQVMNKEPVSPRDLNPSVPKDLETICLKCLTKEPHRRYGSAEELADDLDRFLKGQPVLARPIGAIGRTVRWCRRNPVVASLLALVFMSMAVGTVVSVYYADAAGNLAAREAFERSQAEEARADAETQRDAANEARLLAEQRERETHDQLYVAHMNQAALAWENDNLRRVRQLLDQHVPGDGEPDRRKFVWHYLSRLVNSHEYAVQTGDQKGHHLACSPDGRLIASCGETTVEIRDADSGDLLMQLDVQPGYEGDIAFSPDGSRFVTGGFNRKLEVWDRESFQLLRTVSTPLGIRQIEFHPNGTLVACRHHDERTDRSQVSLIDIDSGETVHAIVRPGRFHTVCFRPDGRILAASSTAREVHFWDVRTGRMQTSWPCPNLTLALTYSPDGQRIALSATERNVEIRDARTGTESARWDSLPGVVLSLNFHPDGVHLLGGSEAGVVHLLNSRSGEHLRDVRGHESKVPDVAFRPGTHQAVTIGKDGWIRAWDLRRQQETVLPNESDPAPHVAFSPDGQWTALACGVPWERDGRGHVEVLDTQTRESVAVLDGHDGGVFGVAFRGDGRQLVSAGADGRVILWDIESQQPIHTIDADTPVSSLAVSSDGRTIAAGGTSRVCLWDSHDGWKQHVFSLPGKAVEGLSISPDNRLVAACSNHGFAVWTLDGTSVIEGTFRAIANNSYGVAFSHDGTTFAVANVGRLELYDLATGRKTADVPAHSQRITSLDFLAGGQRLVTKTHLGEIKIWDLKTLQSLITFPSVDPKGWNGERLAASPDGKWIVAGQNRKELIIHSARSWTRSVSAADPSYWSAVGRQQAGFRQWQSAFENFRRAFTESKDLHLSVDAAACALLADNEEDYRRIVSEGIAATSTSDESTDVMLAGQLARLATHREGVVEDADLLLELAERSWHQNRPGPALLFVLHQRGNDEELLSRSEELLAHGGSERKSALLFRAIALYRLGRISEANESLAAGMRLVEQTYVRSSPGELPVQLDMYASLTELRQEADRTAIEALDAAIESTPDDAILLTARGNIHRRWRRWDAATDDFRNAIDLQPDSMDLLKAAAVTALLAGDTGARQQQDADAIRELARKPEWLRNSWSTARHVALAPRTIDDEQLLNAALARSHQSGWWFQIAPVALLHRMERTVEALQMLNAVAPDPRDWRTEALTSLWRCLLLKSLGRDDEAREAFDAAELVIQERLLEPGLTTQADEVMLLQQQARDVLKQGDEGA
ncbi:MAG: protein kinase [Fuerstiella sp.]